MPRGRPRKERHANDDGKSHRIWDVTDWQLFNQDTGELVAERNEKWLGWIKEDVCKKCMVAKELSDDTKRWHGQCRISFQAAHSFTYVQRLIGAHVEPTRATNDWSYYKKHDSVMVYDVDYRKQGQRNVFQEQKAAIKQGVCIDELLEIPGSNVQSLRSAEYLMQYLEPEREPLPRQVHLVVSAESPMPQGIYRLNNPQYWDGYDGHKRVYINQAVHKLSVPMLRQCIGRAPFRVGRFRQARFDDVYISGLSHDDARALGIDPIQQRWTPIDLLLHKNA